MQEESSFLRGAKIEEDKNPKKGWGFRQMALLMCVCIFITDVFFQVATPIFTGVQSKFGLLFPKFSH